MQSIIFQGQHLHPNKIVCIGRNYADHIAELNNTTPTQMVVFNKPNSAIDCELLAFQGEPIHYEAELCFLARAGKFVAVAAGLDLTKRQLQTTLKQQGLPWERAKAFDKSALFSEFVAIDEIKSDLTIKLSIDNQLVQLGQVGQMLYSPATIVAELAQFMRLQDNDIVMTGTPKGVGAIVKGQRFVAEVLLGDKTLVSHQWQAQ